MEQLDPASTAVDHLKRLDGTLGEQAARLPRRLRLRRRSGPGPVAPFSGGEGASVSALTVYRRPNLLLLDEPTNHLDLDMREALTEALNDFEGAVVLVAHDRALIRACCDTLLLVGGGRVPGLRWRPGRLRAPGAEVRRRRGDSCAGRIRAIASRRAS